MTTRHFFIFVLLASFQTAIAQNVGVGTTSPDTNFTVIGASRAAADPAETSFIEMSHDGQGAIINAQGSGDLSFWLNDSIRMVVTNAGDLVTGMDTLPANGVLYDKHLLFFDKTRAALRSGCLQNSNSWAPDSIGNFSFATGRNTVARGEGAFATGHSSVASGAFAIATGGLTVAHGHAAFSQGLLTRAEAYLSSAFGTYNVGGGNQSTWIESDPIFEIGIGTSHFDKKNAITVLKNGTVAFKEYAFPVGDGSSGQALITNGMGELSWQDKPGQFIKENGVVRNAGSTDDDFVFGMDSLPADGVSYSENLFFFDEGKGAFRAGSLFNSEDWNSAFLGSWSFAAGQNTRASGIGSTAMGKNSDALGLYSVAMGFSSVASGSFAVALGDNTEANGSSSTALGFNSEANGIRSIATGYYTEANGDRSTAMGQRTIADAFGSFALGRYNIGGGDGTLWVDEDPIFEIGTGESSSNKANAMTVLKSGKTGIGTHSPDEALSVVGTIRGALEESESNYVEMGHNGIDAFINADGIGNLDLRHDGTNVMTLTQSQKVGIRTNDPDADLHIKHINSGSSGGLKLENIVSEEWARLYISSSNGHLRLYMDTAGIVGTFDDVSGVYTSTSDRRLKEDFEDLYFDWQSFSKLKPLTYSFKADETHKQHIGMVAQDVELIYPELVTYDVEADRYHMDYAAFGVVAIKAAQEQQKTIEQMQHVLDEKDAQIDALTLRLNRIESAIAGMSEDE